MPFLQQPFKRPVSSYLRRLPEGLNESFEQAIGSIPQNYFELLRLVLTWCLLAPRAVTVKGIVEAYSGVYTVAKDSEIVHGTDTGENAYDPKASELEVQQVKKASGPFLSTERTDDGQTIVKLQDAKQVRKFCEYSAEAPQVCDESASQVCENCRSTIATRSSLVIDPKVAHFEIALILLKHLNSPLFQRRFGLLKEATTNGHETSPRGNVTSEPMVRLAPDQGLENESTPASTNGATGVADRTESSIENSVPVETMNQAIANGNSTEKPQPEIPETSGDGDVKNDGEDDDDYSESSIYESDSESDNESTYSDEAEGSFWELSPELRCEINNWPYHLREAERLWRAEERETSETWTRFNREVQEELKNFVKNQEVFYRWQRVWNMERIWHPNAEEQFKPLHLAAYLGLSAWSESLLDQGADITEVSRNATVAQASASMCERHENIDLLRLLLARGADFYKLAGDTTIPGFHSWLNHCNNPETVKAFVEYDADFDSKDNDGWTGLHSFAWTGFDTESFTSIMNPKDPSKRPNINATDNNNETPLHRLLWRREVPESLFKAFLAIDGINVDHDDNESQRPLAVASSWGSLNIVKLLLEAKADVGDKDSRGFTALHLAAQGDYVECIEVLLDAHSELDSRNMIGSTPLHGAARCSSKAAVEFLLSKGSDINTTNNRNRTPFFDATRCLYGNEETAHFLLQELMKSDHSASDINRITKGGRTPLRQASCHGFVNVVKDLLEHIAASDDESVKATINRGDNKLKRTPLHCAAQRGDPECVRVLLEHGADATLEDSEGKTPLVVARERWSQRNTQSFEELLLLLIDREPEAAVANTELPSIAAAGGSLRVLRKLHSLHADLNRTDSLGWNPLAHAKQLGHKEIEVFLKHQSSWGGSVPSKWVDKRSPSILDERGVRITYTADDFICIISDKPLPPSVENFYFEVTVESLQIISQVAIGFCTLGVQAHLWPGGPPKTAASSATSWGCHSYDGCHYHKGRRFPPNGIRMKYDVGDTVGCGVDLETHKMWFTKNGEKLDFEFEDVRGRLYPMWGIGKPGTMTTNFGQESFKWKNGQFQNADGNEDQ